jgi:NAD(P)H-nitrite reductase large subunit
LTDSSGRAYDFDRLILATRLKVAGVYVASIGDISGKDAVIADRKIFTRDGKIIGAILIGNVKETVKLQQMVKAGEIYQ